MRVSRLMELWTRLYGVMIAQACIYFVRSEHDPKWLRWTTMVLMYYSVPQKVSKVLISSYHSVFETAHTSVLFRTLFFYSVRSIDDPTLLAKMDWWVSWWYNHICYSHQVTNMYITQERTGSFDLIIDLHFYALNKLPHILFNRLRWL